LFAQNLPSDYQLLRVGAITEKDFNFDILSTKLSAFWDDSKLNKPPKAHRAAEKDAT
jgi:hypothetical protein